MKILIICNYASGLYTFRGMLIQELVKKRNIVRAIIPEPEDEKEKRAEIQLKKLHCGLKRVKMERRGMNPVHDISLMKEYYKTIRSLIWRFAERCGAQGISFIVTIVLARLIAPEAYGTIAIINVFINILSVFIDSGMGSALIQKKDADELDFSSLFFFNMGMCCLLYCILFFSAPLIAKFYNNNELVPLVRVIGLFLIVSGIKNVQQAYVSRYMLFKRFFFSTLGGTLVSAIVGIAMAYAGLGVWALVAQSLSNAIIDTIILWITVKWRPVLQFSITRVKALFSFGWKLLCSSLLDTVYNNLRNMIIGKLYSAADLAYYNKADSFPNLIVNNINSSINSVLFPAMSSVQDQRETVKAMTRRSIMVSTYIMAPLMIGLAFVSEPLVSLLLTDKWLACVPYMRIFCITYMFYPIHTANLSAIKAMGRSDLFLKLEIVKKTVGLTVLLITMKHGVLVMAYSLLFVSVMGQIINSWPNRKLLNYGYLEQIKDILPGIILSVVMGGCIYPIQWLGLSNLGTISLQVLLGVAIYMILSQLFKVQSYQYVWDLVKPYLKIDKRKNK